MAPRIPACVWLMVGFPLGLTFAESNHKTLGLRVSSETVPLGAVAHVKVFAATPQPIRSGSMTLTFNGNKLPYPPYDIKFATVFSATGDVYGVGSFQPFAGFILSFASPASAIGRLPDLPLAEFSLVVTGDVAIGITADLIDPDGKSYDLEIQPGSVQIGGALSLQSVTPGAWLVPAGGTVDISGTGFTPYTAVRMEGISIASTAFVSPTLIKVALAADTQMAGKHIRLENQDGQRVDYWSPVQDSFLGSLSLTFPLSTTTSASLSTLALLSTIFELAFQTTTPGSTSITVTNTVESPFVFATHTFVVQGLAALAVRVGLTSEVTSTAPIRVMAYSVLAEVNNATPHAVDYKNPPPPLIGSVSNAASLLEESVSPGEIVTIFGTGGPPSPSGPILDENGNVASTLMGTRVLFDGVPAPLLFVSESQINAVVPYEVFGKQSTTVQVEYNGTASDAWGIPVVSAAPGIFTLDSSSQGQAAVLNQDNSVNGGSTAAARGSVIQIFATGEGQTSPAGVTGSVTGTNPKVPLLPVTVSIAGVDAPVQFAGSAPNSVSGLLQVNAIVPERISPGPAVPLALRIGGMQSRLGATIAVK